MENTNIKKLRLKLYEEWNHAQLISESNTRTMTLWHGGRLDSSYEDSIKHKKGRWEYGPGLYLTTHYDTAKKYAKGSRRLYQITIEEGVDINDAKVPIEKVHDFIDMYVMGKHKKDIKRKLERFTKDGMVDVYYFLNMIINNNAIKNSYTNQLRNFFVENGIDYQLVSNPFGWGEMMVVLYDMSKIIDKKIVDPKDKIDVFDLPVEFK